MGLTNFPNGITSFGIPMAGGILPSTQGKVIHCKPYSGLDGNDGFGPDTAVKTLTKALALATADHNDIVLLYAESNTGTLTSDYQSATLDWNKDSVHLIGVNGGPRLGQRSRVAFASSYVGTSNLFTLTANGCLIANIEFYAGVASANPTGCMKVVGMRNHLVNCQISGIGDDLMDSAGAYSLWLYGAGENVFEKCSIGLETISRGSASNAEILMTAATNAGCVRNIFDRCLIMGWCMSAGNYLFLSANQAGVIGRFLLFQDCVFHNPGTSVATGVQMTQAFQVHAAAGGHVILQNTTIYGADNVNTADTGLVLCGAGTLAANITATDLGLARITTNA